MTRGYRITPRARRDLDEIWAYSVEHWGEDRAERYLRGIQAAIETVADDTRRAVACDDIRPGYRKLHAGSHVIFFKTDVDHVVVVRILHGRMDVGRHL